MFIIAPKPSTNHALQIDMEPDKPSVYRNHLSGASLFWGPFQFAEARLSASVRHMCATTLLLALRTSPASYSWVPDMGDPLLVFMRHVGASVFAAPPFWVVLKGNQWQTTISGGPLRFVSFSKSATAFAVAHFTQPMFWLAQHVGFK